MAVTAVCQHWRTAALNNPYMWTHIRSTVQFPTKYACMAADRSRRMPLLLINDDEDTCQSTRAGCPCSTIYRDYDKTRSIAAFAAENIDRISVLHLALRVPEHIFQLRGEPAPQLQELSIKSMAGPCHLDEPIISCAANLRTLQLEDCSISWQQGTYRRLTKLIVQFSGYCRFGEEAGTIKAISTIFTEFPNLEALHLTTPPFWSPIRDPSSGQSKFMHRLRYLHLNVSIQWSRLELAIQLLSTVSLPALEIATFRAIPFQIGSQAIVAMLSPQFLPAHLFDNSHVIAIRCEKDTATVSGAPSLSGPCCWSVEWDIDAGLELEQVTQAITANFPLPNVDTLKLYWAPGIYRSTAQEMKSGVVALLRSTPCITTLSISHDVPRMAVNFCSFLNRTIQESFEPILPALSSCTFNVQGHSFSGSDIRQVLDLIRSSL